MFVHKWSKILSKKENIPCLAVPHPTSLKIIETNAFDLAYGGILKQKLNNKDVIRYYLGIWKPTQEKYSTNKKDMTLWNFRMTC